MADRILAFSDIHGYAAKLRHALAKAKYNPDRDLLIGCGDYIDRGPESQSCIKLVQGLQANGAIILGGNHEDMLIDYLTSEHTAPYYIYPNNGGLATLSSYGSAPGAITAELYRDAQWIRKLPSMYATDEFIFVHAGLDLTKPLDQQERQDLRWVYEDWVFSQRPHGFGKTVVFGHAMTQRWVPQFLANDIETLLSWQNKYQKTGSAVFHEADRICIDVAAAAGYPVVVHDVTNDISYLGQ